MRGYAEDQINDCNDGIHMDNCENNESYNEIIEKYGKQI